ncbi:flagellar motor switch protein FliN, partial [Escherichia coli]|nr:flagellar motor switch protein FliN [Escherichia coli]
MDTEPHDIIPTDPATDQPAPVFEDFDNQGGAEPH